MTDISVTWTPNQVRTLVQRLLRWFSQHARNLPWRHTRDPYALWIAEVMLQQTRVNTVIPYWQHWIQTIPDIPTLARTRQDQLRKLWAGLGYYRRLENLHRAAKLILKHHHGRFPDRYEDILALPGIGRYTAGAIASTAFNLPTPVVDGNVARVLSRLTGRPLRAPSAAAWSLATQLVQQAARHKPIPLQPLAPPGRPRSAPLCPPCSALNQSLMELGATVCLPAVPRCHDCPLQTLCTYRHSSQPDPAPTRNHIPTTPRHLRVYLVRHNGRWLLHQRPANQVNAGFWELPATETNHVQPHSGHFFTNLDPWFEPLPDQPGLRLTHHITRHRYLVEARFARLKQPWPGGRWLTPRQIQNRPLTRLTQKILHHLGVLPANPNAPLAPLQPNKKNLCLPRHTA
ncbi:A/G-specific adenine glycosylase [Limisphaera ngatamarikiensis]|uniref:Adenine DNA glycosylase n=1 Tax=Limisphaera ngatamarikiensis TaxID=1324935 RepID=A0A6M1RNH4_9BACT|nr:A/G-specific adenine glycosylase [Limisphaera ngatamarikiensis]NGO39109.1 A/G-specific adenine glycosylase [Limisphaera ngatamarikiensis]